MYLTSLLFSLTVGLAVCSADRPPNSVARSLMAEGVSLGSDACVKLPEPVMPEGLAASAQEAVLRKAADRYPLEEFLRDSPVARFALNLQPLLDSQGQAKRPTRGSLVRGLRQPGRRCAARVCWISWSRSARRRPAGWTPPANRSRRQSWPNGSWRLPSQDGVEESYRALFGSRPRARAVAGSAPPGRDLRRAFD